MNRLTQNVYLDALEQLAQNGIPGPGSAPIIDIGTSEYLEFFRAEYIDACAARGNSICRFFEGPFGSGKTHLLQLLAKLGHDKRFAVARLDLSQALNLVDWHHITRFILENLTFSDNLSEHKGLPNILDRLSETTESTLLLKEHLPQPGFQRAMFYGMDVRNKSTEYRQALSRFLQGEKVLVSQLRQLDLKGVRGSLSLRNADQILKTALNGLYSLGLPTMILLDENERTLHQSSGATSSKHKRAANLMRKLIDACASGGLQGTIIAFTVLPNFIQMCVKEYPALGQRLRTVPPSGLRPSWRTPVLEIADVNSIANEDEFLTSAVSRFVEISKQWNIGEQELPIELMTIGKSVLDRNAGSGYRRDLMKTLSSHVLKKIR